MSKPGSENGYTFSGGFLSHDSVPSHPTEWLDALRTDNVEAATAFLQSTSTKYKDFLMNSDIPGYNKHIQRPSHRKKLSSCTSMEFRITKPLHAAAIFHSHAVLRLLLESGVDVLQVDSCQNNVVHMLVYADYTYSVHGTKHGETLAHLQELLSPEELKSLMVAENMFLLRPLEFAALYGCNYMLAIILQTKDVYLTMEENMGYNIVQYFDLSDYELFDRGLPPRFFKSPLYFLIFAETSRLEMVGSNAVFGDPMLQSWIHAKIVMNWPFVFIWFLFRFFYIGLFFWVSMDTSWPTVVVNASLDPNDTEEMVVCFLQNPELGSYHWYTLASICTVILIYDFFCNIFANKGQHPALTKLLKRRDYIVHVQFFYWTQFATCLSIVGIFVCQKLRSTGFSVPLTIDNILFVFISCGSMWGVIYFLQVLPWISIYAIAVQRMLQDFFRFALIFVIFLSAFALSFRRILLGDSYECPKNFGTIGETLYSSFLVMINFVNFREYQHVDKVSLYLLHVVFVFFIPILQINFLIAAMTRSFSDVYANRQAITQTQRLALMVTIQMRLARPMRVLYKLLQKRVFVYHNKRLCLRRYVIKGMDFETVNTISNGNGTWGHQKYIIPSIGRGTSWASRHLVCYIDKDYFLVNALNLSVLISYFASKRLSCDNWLPGTVIICKWASCPICNSACCASAEKAWNVPPVSLEVGGGENSPGIPGACASLNFTYLVRVPRYY